MSKQVVLIRHGETDWNAEQRWQGHTDIPLNQNGKYQAERLVDDLRPYSLEVLVSSDLTRALETAQVIASHLATPLFRTEALREVNVGRIEGLGHRDVIELLGPEAIERWRSIDPKDLEFAFPQGETKLEGVSRALRALSDFLVSVKADRVGVVTHGMLIRSCIHYLFPHLKAPLIVPNCGFFVISYDPSTRDWGLKSAIESGVGREPWEEPWKTSQAI